MKKDGDNAAIGHYWGLDLAAECGHLDFGPKMQCDLGDVSELRLPSFLLTSVRDRSYTEFTS